ncbi:unnamed protein product [Rotaria sp. Silwood2]|nr:unnamed protein product [Rotaria sp. Silwood2]CAF3001857.1 unnamed protein product [Rotaria sp. Silwood2]CAF3103719.1 unnamed protein product [Rotaria sp. Silwood2]CAF4362072.1 unnamed protein product [Rotaria sp. Silwood2]CAF4483436.1 unnamed protein product [Rotaria sp. Silwood2]
MIIVRYLGNVYSIFHAFSGLNQRFNRILIDRRLHLLTDFLHMNNRVANVDHYYDSPLVRMLSEKLCLLRSHNLKTELRSCFQKLVTFHIQEQYRQVEYEFLSNREQYQSIRANLDAEEIRFRDLTLKKAFNELKSHSTTLENIQQLKTFVLRKGARLECTDSELGKFNLANAINQYLLAYFNTLRNSNWQCLNSLVEMFKVLIISNPNLIKNKDYVGNGGCPTYFFFIYIIYRLQDFYSCSSSISIDMRRYQSIIELFLFTIQCLKSIFNENSWTIDCLMNSLQWMTSIEKDIDQEIIIQTSQVEILKILFKEFTQKEIILDDYWDNRLHRALHNLIINNRIDIILYISHQHEFLKHFFDRSENYRTLINMMTGNQSRRLLFKRLLDEKPLETWLTSTKLLFILLEKKECKLIKKLLRVIPSFVQQTDNDGNDPLLYVCLKVSGCRHRLVEFLISMGCDLQRRNIHDEHFFQVLQGRKNRKLLETLIERATIVIDKLSGQYLLDENVKHYGAALAIIE